MSGDTPKKGQHNKGRKQDPIKAKEAEKPKEARGHMHGYQAAGREYTEDDDNFHYVRQKMRCRNMDGKCPQPEYVETIATTPRKKAAPVCLVCGLTMKFYQNPPEWKCTNVAAHARIEAAGRQGGGTGARNRGQRRPGAIGNLGALGRKRPPKDEGKDEGTDK
jgi:hypothetical protein